MHSLGIDIGKYGGLVEMDPRGAVTYWSRTPLAAKEYDGFAMATALETAKERAGGDVRAFIERPNVMGLFPPQAMAVGAGFGRWMQALEMIGIGWVAVSASVWTKMYLPAKGKKMTREERKANEIMTARRLCPTRIPWDRLNKQARSGVADSYLIANYGRLKG